MAKNVRYSSEPIKISIKYLEELKGTCPLCKSIVQRKYNTSEKTIFQLFGPITVRYDLVTCTNKICPFFRIPFNPTPRFDYSKRRYEKDVLT